jgi:hypothetical protein
VLPIHQLTKEQAKQDGEIAKHYKATIKTLMGYSKEQEAALKEYEKINKKYKDEKKKVEAEIEKRKQKKEKEQP